ncbi:TetR/AcrR family transcriptional regulator [Terrihabitans rhizophilus]|uniref:TetR/AcrR family transcriptional regulator n=1 Tax=Terrihabitans rhizophilus TaxID=3092662 RepID=A0ABU4RMA0_9HYPH|nr:TetR/AcrR family transcriptional regulator [Terrihabitans sp. PJ23]MDX6805706.1 TetR/AcrR family transcriptional regulator [Terrihabitans sp. PJ23]
MRAPGERGEIIPKLGEVFREHGFEGASLARITEATGLGKGSLYHFFPGGKDEMASAVLDEISHWFAEKVFHPLRSEADPASAVAGMFAAVETYFRSGDRVCLVGAFALNDVRDRFAGPISRYFKEWREALAAALRRGGRSDDEAAALAEEAIAAIQGALVTARAMNDPALFVRILRRSEQRLGLAPGENG